MKNNAIAEGDYILGNNGWQEYWISNGKGVKIINTDVAEPQHYWSVRGMTAYVGLIGISKLKGGETVFVSTASGAVGSIDCQIAKIKKFRVEGNAGSAKKIEWLKDKSGIDLAFNDKNVDGSAKVNERCPDGIDDYFDNVGERLSGRSDRQHEQRRTHRLLRNDFCFQRENSAARTEQSVQADRQTNPLGRLYRSRSLGMNNEFIENMMKWIKGDKIVWKKTSPMDWRARPKPSSIYS